MTGHVPADEHSAHLFEVWSGVIDGITHLWADLTELGQVIGRVTLLTVEDGGPIVDIIVNDDSMSIRHTYGANTMTLAWSAFVFDESSKVQA